LQVKWIGLIGGPLGIFFSVGLGIAAGLPFGLSVVQGATLGAIISVASTMVLSRLLIDAHELHSPHGKAAIGITLVEDVAVVLMTILLPVANDLSGERIVGLLHLLGKAALIMVPIALAAWKLVPSLLARVAKMDSNELFILVAVALGFGTAALTQAVGLSLALGAFLAGMLISGSPYAHETLSKLLPLRDVFVAVFFVSVGTLINPAAIWERPGLLLMMLLLIVVGKFAIWAGIALLFRYPWPTAVRIGVGLTQIGEFSYVLVRVARDASLVDDTLYNCTLMASLLSIILNAFLVRAARQFTPDPSHAEEAAA
jgi:CPA2 family monovalent cation:H+ antiporter-2